MNDFLSSYNFKSIDPPPQFTNPPNRKKNSTHTKVNAPFTICKIIESSNFHCNHEVNFNTTILATNYSRIFYYISLFFLRLRKYTQFNKMVFMGQSEEIFFSMLDLLALIS